MEFMHNKSVKLYRRNSCTPSLMESIYIFNPSSNKSPFPNHSLIVFLRLHKLFCSRRQHHNHNRWHLDENSDLQSQYCLYLQYGNISSVVFYYENHSNKTSMNMKFWYQYLPKAIAAKTIVVMKVGINFIVPDEMSSLVYSTVIFKICSIMFDFLVDL